MLVLVFLNDCLSVHFSEAVEAARWEAAQANLAQCRYCARRFNPDRIVVHERICSTTKSKAIPPPNVRGEGEDVVTGDDLISEHDHRRNCD